MPFYILYIFEMTNAPLGWRFVQVQASVWCARTGCSYKNVQKDSVIINILLLAFFRGTRPLSYYYRPLKGIHMLTSS